ncbi:hypothetical protein BOTBODRAFT_64068 [Botryobasidium botryosum FD-172 SS1]|uniref:G domain-containing protein n=1 Tax=Botryobasidium botryosum (strain FD-172 SS1) TaxID=930990 RepID=A0A067N1D9_BOTB1|nr:hypothetical protein BOTBODRAFT_64068 [Botryobasidium botryosum FD-172 SS1]
MDTINGLTAQFTSYASLTDIRYTPEGFLGQGLAMVRDLKAHINRVDIGNDISKETWLTEIESLEGQRSSTAMIAVYGATGSGKSSAINAILDDTIVPTSGMRACTAVVTEISYHSRNSIAAEVTFLSLKQWKDELAVLLDDLRGEDGKIKHSSDLQSESGTAWYKIRSVYPKLSLDSLAGLTVDEVLELDSEIMRHFGTVEKIDAKNSKEFSKKISRYIESRDDSTQAATDSDMERDEDGPALWPLIRQVKVRCSSQALSTGAVLVDLPGVADANVARSNIAKDYMENCDFIWIVTPVTRAIDDQVAKDLLGRAFKTQLMRLANADCSIALIATKCDDISCSEIIRTLKLKNHPALQKLEADLGVLQREIKRWGSKRVVAERALKQIDRELKISDGAGANSNPSGTESSSDSDSGNSTDPGPENEDDEGHQEHLLSTEEAAARLHVKGVRRKGVTERRNEALQLKKEAADMILALEKSKFQLQREKNAFCSLKRSEASRSTLQRDFRAGLKEFDDRTAERIDPSNFDPATNLRDYDSIEVPVFTLSSRDYIRLTKQIKGDGDPVCFCRAEETGVPALRDWCRMLAMKAREKASRTFRNHLRVFATSIKSCLDNIGTISEVDSKALRKQWETAQFHRRYSNSRPGSGANITAGISMQLEAGLRRIVSVNVQEMKTDFRGQLEERCRVSAEQAASIAGETYDAFAESMHWVTFRATLRRNGSWRRDLNEELAAPMNTFIASSWARVFEANLFSSFETKAAETIVTLLEEFQASCPASIQYKAHIQIQACREEAINALTRISAIGEKELSRGQKAASRHLVPRIRQQMVGGYREALTVTGRGSVAAQKSLLRNFVGTKKDHLFQSAADAVLESLDKIAVAVGEGMNQKLRGLGNKVEANLATLWAYQGNTKYLPIECTQAIVCIENILAQLTLWEQADKMRTQAPE